MSDTLLSREDRVMGVAGLIDRADIIRIDESQYVSGWTGPEVYENDDENLMFYFSWVDSEGVKFGFSLTEEALATATLEGNKIVTWEAETGEDVTLELFKLEPIHASLDEALFVVMWDRYVVKWNGDLDAGRVERIRLNSASNLATEDVMMWFHIMKQEIEMWIRLGIPVTESELRAMAQRRGAGEAECDYWRELLKEVKLYGEDQIHDSPAARAEA